MERRRASSSWYILLALAVGALLITVVFGTYLQAQPPANGNRGTVSGTITVSPQCPASNPGCGPIDFSQYTVYFRYTCGAGFGCPPLTISTTPTQSGHFSTTMPAGNYTVTLSQCPWTGCPQDLPLKVSVTNGVNPALNILISNQ